MAVLSLLVKKGPFPPPANHVKSGEVKDTLHTWQGLTMKRTSKKNPRIPTDRILKRLHSLLPELRKQYRVKSLGLFGSYVHGRHRKTSDIDILVEFDRAPSLFKFVELQEYLSTALGIKVDLVMKTALRPAIGERILAEVVPV